MVRSSPNFLWVWSLSAQDEKALRELSGAAHDAYFDPRDGRRDATTFVLPFQQEGWHGGPAPDGVLVAESWRVREYRVAFFHGELIVHHVNAVRGADDWGDAGTLLGVGYDRDASEVEICAGEPLRLAVERLAVEVRIYEDVAGHVRRRVGKYTRVVTDFPPFSFRQRA